MIAMSNNNIEQFDKATKAETTEPEPKGNKRRYQRRGKPPYSYVALVAMCIQSSPNKRLRLREILKNIETMFPFFQGDYKGWRDSVRHNLTQNSCFKQILRDPTKPNGKGNYWTVSVEEIPGEMFKRQNTSVAYQAPEGKTYASDLREVYDFYSGMSKVSPGANSIFEHTILQEINTSPTKTTPPPISSQNSFERFHQMRYQQSQHHHQQQHHQQHQQHQPHHHHQNIQPSFNQLPKIMPPQYPFTGPPFLDPFFNQMNNSFQYNNFFVGGGSGNNTGSLPHSPSSASSPQSSVNLEFDWSDKKSETSPIKSASSITSNENTAPVAMVEYHPTPSKLKRERTQSELEADEVTAKVKRCRQEMVRDFAPTSFTSFKDLDKCVAPNQTVTVTPPPPGEEDPFTRRGLRPKVPPTPPVKSATPGSHKHSIRNILNLDQLDGADGPQVLDPEQNSEQLVRSGAFVRINKFVPFQANYPFYQQHHQHHQLFPPFATFAGFDQVLK